MRAKSTLRDVAEAVGVSVNTVSRVLNGHAEYLRPTYARRAEVIRRKAEELGYMTNSFAKAMRYGKSGTVCLLQSTTPYRSNRSGDLIDGLTDALHENGMRLLVERLPDEVMCRRGAIPRVLKEYSADALIVNYTDRIPENLEKSLDESGAPVVWLNVKREYDCVRYDDEGGGYAAAEWILANGHTCAAYVQAADWDGHYSTADRAAGFARCMRDHGREPLIFGNLDGRHLDPDEIHAERTVLWRKLLDCFEKNGVSAVVAYSDFELLHSMEALRRIPGIVPDPAGISFRDMCRCAEPYPYPSVWIDGYSLGREAIGMLMKKISDNGSPQPSIVMSETMNPS